MKQNDVTVGSKYLTRCSGELVPVTVIGVRTVEHTDRWGASKTYTRFTCRTDAGRVLPKARTAAALRPLLSNGSVSVAVTCLAIGMKSATHGPAFMGAIAVKNAMRALCTGEVLS